jgi:hypothetical protein
VGLEAVEFIIRIEQTFGIHLEDAEVLRVLTIGDLEQLVMQKLELERRSTSGVYEAIVRVLEDEFSHDREQISRATRFARDLNFT